MIRVVLDTNVFVAAMLSSRGAPFALIQAWTQGSFEVVVSEALVREIVTVLARPSIAARVPAADAKALIALPRARAILAPDAHEPGAPDPGDAHVLGLALSAADVLVTGDLRLFGWRGRPVVDPRAFLEHLGATQRGGGPRPD